MITSSVRRTFVSALYLSMSRNKSKSVGSGGPSSSGSKSTPGAVDGDVQQAGCLFHHPQPRSFASDLGTAYSARSRAEGEWGVGVTHGCIASLHQDETKSDGILDCFRR
jgi:hypothetical protein